MPADNVVMVLGGAGLVGSQIVRQISRDLHPQKIVIASLFRGEVREFLHDVRKEFPQIEFVGAWGDVFVREEFSQERRRRLLSSTVRRDALYQDLFGTLDETYERSSMVAALRAHRPDVLVDCINTATAISYQDIESTSKRTHDLLDDLKEIVDHQDFEGLSNLGRQLEENISTLLISQSTAQLIRHVQILHRVMTEVGTRLYLKIGTSGTGGMGLNVPYTHSEDKPSAKLMRKNAMAFAHTGLMFLMARTPNGPLVKELKPAALIGYRQVTHKSIKVRGQPQFRYASREERLGDKLSLRGKDNQYPRLGRLRMAGIDTGENGFFTRGEFETITHLNQMEFVTPEEIAEQAVLEIKGSNTGFDVIASLDSSIMGPSYRAGVLRQTALDQLARIERETESHSVALGQLGPPELSKLLFESHLLRLNYGTLDAVREAAADEIAATLYDHVQRDENLRTTATSIGVPILSPDGAILLRGPKLNIPESVYREVPLDSSAIDVWARKGWVDLRAENMSAWQERFQRMERTRHAFHTRGSAAITTRSYLHDTIEIGAVVAWIFNNEEEGYRIK